MILDTYESLSLLAAIIGVAVGLSATVVWFMFVKKLMDPMMQRTIFYCTAAILLLSLSEIAFIKQALILRASAYLSPEAIYELDIFEYLRYSMIAAAYLMLVLAANIELRFTGTYNFMSSKFDKTGRKKAK